MNAVAAVLRRAVAADLPTVAPMQTAFHREHGIDADLHTRPAVEALLGPEAPGGIWLIESGDRVVGYVAVGFGWSIEFGGRDAFVDEIYLQPAARGRGLGRAALTGIADAVRELGVRMLHLEVDRRDARAIGLYAGAGFAARERYMLMSRDLRPSR